MTRRTPAPVEADAERLERAAAKLSPLERDILVLSAGQGLANDQIAAELGLSERDAERILASALRKFDRALRQRGWLRWNCR